jgi:hypothetical protein
VLVLVLEIQLKIAIIVAPIAAAIAPKKTFRFTNSIFCITKYDRKTVKTGLKLENGDTMTTGAKNKAVVLVNIAIDLSVPDEQRYIMDL